MEIPKNIPRSVAAVSRDQPSPYLLSIPLPKTLARSTVKRGSEDARISNRISRRRAAPQRTQFASAFTACLQRTGNKPATPVEREITKRHTGCDKGRAFRVPRGASSSPGCGARRPGRPWPTIAGNKGSSDRCHVARTGCRGSQVANNEGARVGERIFRGVRAWPRGK